MSTATTMQNLFNKEEVLELNLKNISYEVKFYLKQLADFRNLKGADHYLEKANWFEAVFQFYLQDLIPALEESAAMEEKHLQLMNRNPDSNYQPIKMEVDCHHHTINTFIERFQDTHAAYYNFITKARFALAD